MKYTYAVEGNIKMRDKTQNIINCLKDHSLLLGGKQVTVGFDGFVDSIVRLVKSKNSGGNLTYFQEIAEFGSYIIDKQGKSCSIELEEVVNKIGGNMPIMANALGQLGIKVSCLGAMGFPDINKVFADMSANCKLYSFAEPGFTIALEFNDGKIMMARMDTIHNVTWEKIKRSVGLENIINFFNNSDFVGMVNWSELDNSSYIWEGVIKEVLPLHKPDKNQVIFFDLADCSKREMVDIVYAINLIEQFSDYYKVILSLNENESRLIYNSLETSPEPEDLVDVGNKIYDCLNIDELVIHPAKFSLAWDKNGMYRADTLFVDNPMLSTGGGDNFNAGLCIGELLGLGTEDTLILANCVAGFYVRNGISPDISQLLDYIFEYQKVFSLL